MVRNWFIKSSEQFQSSFREVSENTNKFRNRLQTQGFRAGSWESLRKFEKGHIRQNMLCQLPTLHHTSNNAVKTTPKLAQHCQQLCKCQTSKHISYMYEVNCTVISGQLLKCLFQHYRLGSSSQWLPKHCPKRAMHPHCMIAQALDASSTKLTPTPQADPTQPRQLY